MKTFSALRCGPVTLHLIDSWNLRDAIEMVCRYADRKEFYEEIMRSYTPAHNSENVRLKWGFYARHKGEIAGLSLLGVDPEDLTRGYTGADTLAHMRGQGVAPNSKPALFYLGFELLGLTRIETGCHVSNKASKRSIEKTLGFEFSGVASPGKYPNAKGEMEDELMYVITRESWERLYADVKVEVIA